VEHRLDRRLRSIADRVAHDFELEVFDVQLRREAIGWVLRIIIDRSPSGSTVTDGEDQETVSVADCQRMSKDVSVILDAEINFEHPYTLEVSSPGLDRPLRNPDDCRRFLGRLAKFVTSESINGHRHLTGRIEDVETKGATKSFGSTGPEILLKTSTGIHRIPWSLVNSAQLEVEF